MWNYLSSLFKRSHRGPRPPLETQLVGPRVILRTGDPMDWHGWRALRDISRDYLVPWEPAWPPNALTYNYFCALLRKHWRDWKKGTGYAFLIFKRSDDGQPGALLGSITLSDVQRSIAQKGTLGYWVGKLYAGQGYMTEAAGLVCNFAFDTLKLHRIEAACLPHNEPSKSLLKHLGFEQEGYAKAYLKINGFWEDHILWGKTAPPRPH
jgi:ribosomal-protein-alanine N-acetyltransferase